MMLMGLILIILCLWVGMVNSFFVFFLGVSCWILNFLWLEFIGSIICDGRIVLVLWLVRVSVLIVCLLMIIWVCVRLRVML